MATVTRSFLNQARHRKSSKPNVTRYQAGVHIGRAVRLYENCLFHGTDLVDDMWVDIDTGLLVFLDSDVERYEVLELETDLEIPRTRSFRTAVRLGRSRNKPLGKRTLPPDTSKSPLSRQHLRTAAYPPSRRQRLHGPETW